MMPFFVYARAKAKGLLSEERQLKSRSRRLNRIRSAAEAMWMKIQRDLRSSDPNRFLTALAVALMSETGEDNVVGWRKKNVAMDDFSANYRHAGKRKPITNAAVVNALRDAYEAVEDGGDELFSHDMGRVTADMVDDYLSNFKLSLKDLRGLNANREMVARLAAERATGPELPKNKRSRAKVLRGEFFKTLEATAESVGLDPEEVRNTYLEPGLEASYCENGNLGVKTAGGPSSVALRVAERFSSNT